MSDHKVTYDRVFTNVKNPLLGFGFPCDEQGNIFFDRLSQRGHANALACLNGTMPHHVERGIVCSRRTAARQTAASAAPEIRNAA